MNDLAHLLNRPKLYANIDGVAELSIGIMLLGFSALQWEQARSAPGTVWHQLYLLVLVLGLMVAVIHYGARAIREHITYPRTGYVKYRRRDTLWMPILFGTVSGALGAALMVVAIHRHWATSPELLIGLLLAAGYGYAFARSARWKWLVAAALALVSVAIAALPAPMLAAIAGNVPPRHLVRDHRIGALLLSFLLWGVILLLSGAVSFALYLRHTAPPAAEAQTPAEAE